MEIQANTESKSVLASILLNAGWNVCVVGVVAIISFLVLGVEI